MRVCQVCIVFFFFFFFFFGKTLPIYIYAGGAGFELYDRKSQKQPPPQGQYATRQDGGKAAYSPRKRVALAIEFAMQTRPAATRKRVSRFSLPLGQSKIPPPPQGRGWDFGLPDRIRTCGLESRSLALYPAGLRVDDGIKMPPVFAVAEKRGHFVAAFAFGGDEGARTLDLTDVNRAL